jgi:hypothetical protein
VNTSGIALNSSAIAVNTSGIISTCIHTYIQTYMYIYIHAYIHLYIHMTASLPVWWTFRTWSTFREWHRNTDGAAEGRFYARCTQGITREFLFTEFVCCDDRHGHSG